MSLTREQDRDRMRRKRAEMTPAEREEYNRKCRERMARLSRSRGIPTRAERWASHRTSRPARVVTIKPRPAPRPKPRKPVVPSEIRTAWSKAHPNSVIRLKFPTMAALESGMGR